MANTREEKLFADMRALCNGAKTQDNWRALSYRVVNDAGYTRAFRAEFEPALLDLLDRTWPDTQRIADATMDMKSRRYAKVFRVSITDARISKQTVALAARQVSSGAHEGQYNGLFFDRVKGLSDRLFDAIVETKKVGPLEHFMAWNVSDANTNYASRTDTDEVLAMVEAVLDRDGAHLKSFGGDLGGEQWDLFLERAGELVALDTLYGELGRWLGFAEALEGLGLRRLGFIGAVRGEPLALLLGKPFAARVEEVSGQWGGDHLDFLRWLEQGHAPQVRRWCIHDEELRSTEVMNFSQERATYWRDRMAGVEKHPLDATECVLEPLDPEALHEVLFDASGALRPSERLEALCVPKPLEWEDVRALLEQAPEAWPNLRMLSLDNRLDQDAEIRDSLEVDALFSQLDVATWTHARHEKDARFCDEGTVEHDLSEAKKRVSDYREAVGRYLDGFASGRWHDAIAYRLAVRIVRCTDKDTTMRALAKMVGIQPSKGARRDALAPQVFDALVALYFPEGVTPSPFSSDVAYSRLRGAALTGIIYGDRPRL